MYKKSDIRSIGELHTFNGGRKLTPVFKGYIMPIFVNVTKEEFEEVRGDVEKMKDLAIEKLNAL
jgi:hypothetical protein